MQMYMYYVAIQHQDNSDYIQMNWDHPNRAEAMNLLRQQFKMI